MLDANVSNPSLARLQFATPTDQIGAFQVSVRYSLPLRWDGQKPLPLTLPLVLPVDQGDDDQFAGQQLEFMLAEGLQIEPDLEGDDELTQPTALGGTASDTYSWSSPPVFSRWTVEPSQGTKVTTINVSQVWVQTWLAPRFVKSGLPCG